MNLVDPLDPILHRPNLSVIEDQFLRGGERLVPMVNLLVSTMQEQGVFGISACQIGVDLALFCIEVDGDIKVCANPQILAASLAMEKQEESCPSFPGLKLLITRPEAVAVRYNNLDGTEITEKLEGAVARAWLHEYDHTQGICFTDRASRLHRNMAKKRLTKILKRSQA